MYPQAPGIHAFVSLSSVSSKAAVSVLSLFTLGLGDQGLGRLWFQLAHEQGGERVGCLPNFDTSDSTGLSPFGLAF